MNGFDLHRQRPERRARALFRVLALVCLSGCLLQLGAVSAAAAHTSVAASLAVDSLLLGGARAGERVVAVGERGHVLLSDDCGESWRQVVAPSRATLTGVYFHDRQLGWAVGHDAVILRTADGGESWQLVYSAPELNQPLLDIWFKDERSGIAVGAYGLLLASEDGGATWEQRAVGDSDWHLNSISVAPDGSLYLAAEAGNLYRTVDGGASWESLDVPYEGSFFGMLSLRSGALLVYGLRGNLFRSDDRGASWERLDTGVVALLSGGRELADGRVVIVGLDGVVLESSDGGSSFQLCRQPGRKAITEIVCGADGRLLLLTESGVEEATVGRVAQGAAAALGGSLAEVAQ